MRKHLLIGIVAVGLCGCGHPTLPEEVPTPKTVESTATPAERIYMNSGTGLAAYKIHGHKYLIYESSQAVAIIHDLSCECLQKSPTQ